MACIVVPETSSNPSSKDADRRCINLFNKDADTALRDLQNYKESSKTHQRQPVLSMDFPKTPFWTCTLSGSTYQALLIAEESSSQNNGHQSSDCILNLKTTSQAVVGLPNSEPAYVRVR